MGPCGRSLVALVVALGAVACGDKSPCDASTPTVDVVVTGGREAFASYALSGACTGGGTPADCEIESCDATPCPCHVRVRIQPGSDAAAPPTSCHIEVAATGAYFVVDVGVIEWSDECHPVELADNSQATITVDFTGP